MKNTDRVNRVQIEWARFLTPNEYTLLDFVLFRSYLTHANGGTGFRLHVRKLEEESNVARSQISRIFQKWSFMEKKGSTKDAFFIINYPAFMDWIVRLMDNKKIVPEGSRIVPHRDNKSVIVPPGDNDCPMEGHRSISTEENNNIKKSTNSLLLEKVGSNETGNIGTNSIVSIVSPEQSEGLEPPAGIQASPPNGDANDCPIQGQSSYTYKRIKKITLPKGMVNAPTVERQKYILGSVNAGGTYQFKLGAVDGYRFAGIDWSAQSVLLTSEHSNEGIDKNAISHINKKKWKSFVWMANTQELFEIETVH